MAEQETVVAVASTLFDADESELARDYLTRYSAESGLAGLRLGNALLASIEARTAVGTAWRTLCFTA